MNQPEQAGPTAVARKSGPGEAMVAGGDSPEVEALRARVGGTNINPETLLATDYLNHFNEIVMMLDMVPDMPDLVEDCREWQPKSYAEHFADSTFRDKDLAIEAFGHCPARYRAPFDETIHQIDTLALSAVARMEALLASGETEAVAIQARSASRAIQRLMDMASAIMHGAQTTMHQDEIDAMLGH